MYESIEIPFNKPFLAGKEIDYIKETIELGKISGNGHFTKKCHDFFEQKYKFNKVLLTTSCTHSLEMAAILLNLKAGDEVIIPSYTFVSTANAFIMHGGKVIFADSNEQNPNINESLIEPLINERTRAIVPVHYAGIACNMELLMDLAAKYNLFIIEDAAQAINSYYKNKPLGGIGHLGALSFHETKNINSGEGGLLIINDMSFIERSEIIWEKGTNRSAFFRGEIDKYNWVDIGSSYLPSEIIAAFLYAQLECLEKIQAKRIKLWNLYFERLKIHEEHGIFRMPYIPDYATNNAHMFYILLPDIKTRTKLIDHLKKNSILSIFHYLSLHKSPYFIGKHDGRELPNSDRYSDSLLRLPLFFELQESQVMKICDKIDDFFR
jgi:dTDP-4-amino-4,6-dideoxygalactose transaminase